MEEKTRGVIFCVVVFATFFVGVLIWLISGVAKQGKLEKELTDELMKKIPKMYASGKTDDDVADYLDSIRYKSMEVWKNFHPFYNHELTVECMVRFPEEIHQFKSRMRKLYPKAYRTYSWDHPRVHEFTIRFLDHKIAVNSQFSGSSSRSTSQMDWEKGATGTAIFGPTGVALGMMDEDENKY